jgi:hypothetical protein
MTMRIANPIALATVVRDTGGRRANAPRAHRRSLLQRVNPYPRWAFNPQRELTSRYDRAA